MVRKFWFLALCVAVCILIVVASVMTALRARSSSSRLPERGSVVERLASCPSPAEILFDGRGVAHVRAEDEPALWFALGYLHARDRFFQMDMARRTASGRLSEVLGPRAVAVDRRMRIWRVAASARSQVSRLGVSERWALESYADGVNAALTQHGRWISPESWLLGLDPEPWAVEDSLSLGLLSQLAMSPAMGAELRRAVELARLGEDRAVDLWGWSPEESGQWIPPAPAISTPRQPDEAIRPSFAGVGSNAWAVAPSRSATGRALLANDPHLEVGMPEPFYAIHLSAPELQVAGLSVPGAPGILIGHNDRVAWGITNALIDDQDLYVLTLDDSRTAELIDGSLQDLRAVTERISVRWQEEPEVLKIQISERGPVVRDRGREVIALEWTGLRAPSLLGSVLETNRARTVEDVADAWDGSAGPYFQVVAADAEGHILQFVTGRVPGRRAGAGRLPAPGQDSRWAWAGLEPIARSTLRRDPEDGLVAAANHDPFQEGDYPSQYAVPGEYQGPWRVRRIRSALAARHDWRIDDFVALQGDIRSDLAVALLQQLRPDLEAHRGPTAAELTAWDGRMTADGVAPHLYSRLIVELTQAVGGDEAARSGLASSSMDSESLLRLLAGGMDPSWWDDSRTAAVEGRATVVARVLDRIDALEIRQPWGQVHGVSFAHPLARVPIVGRWLGRAWSRGPFPLGGDGTTVNAAYWVRQQPYAVVAAPAARFVADVGNWDTTVVVLPVGQSGRPWSPHYSDQVGAWLHLEPVTLPYSRAAVDAAAKARLVLVPSVSD